jgi:hypothetical protein
MQTPVDRNKQRHNNSEWYLLAEGTLSGSAVDAGIGDETTPGVLFQTAQGLGIPPECLRRIKKTLEMFAQEMREFANLESFEMQVSIRLFYQKKTVAKAHSPGTLQPMKAEQANEPPENIRYSDPAVGGGWGYFLIERGKDFRSGSSSNAPACIDLYLYREGD